MFVEVREPHTEKLLFKYDPCREIIEIVQRQKRTLVDLTLYKEIKKEKNEGILVDK